MMRVVARATILGLFGLLFAYDVWEAVSNFIGIYTQGLPFGLVLTVWGWVFLLFAIVAPIILFVLAAVLTRKTSVVAGFVVFLLALMISAVLSLDITLVVPITLLLG